MLNRHMKNLDVMDVNRPFRIKCPKCCRENYIEPRIMEQKCFGGDCDYVIRRGERETGKVKVMQSEDDLFLAAVRTHKWNNLGKYGGF